MEQVSEIESNHADLIHDVAYDFYGKRSVPASLAAARSTPPHHNPPLLVAPTNCKVPRCREPEL